MRSRARTQRTDESLNPLFIQPTKLHTSYDNFTYETHCTSRLAGLKCVSAGLGVLAATPGDLRYQRLSNAPR